MSQGFVVWEDRFNLGNKMIDTQHKQIVDMFNDLYEARFHGIENRVVSEVIEGMARYVREHFAAEERLMAQVQYPHLERHRQEHEFFVKESGRLGFLQDRADAEKLMVFLRDWFVQHIGGSYHTIQPYLKKY